MVGSVKTGSRLLGKQNNQLVKDEQKEKESNKQETSFRQEQIVLIELTKKLLLDKQKHSLSKQAIQLCLTKTPSISFVHTHQMYFRM